MSAGVRIKIAALLLVSAIPQVGGMILILKGANL